MAIQAPKIYFPGQYTAVQNQVPTAISQPVVSQDVYAPDVVEDPSLGSQITGGLVFMAPIQGRHVIAHPLRSWNALKRTNATFNTLRASDAFKNLTKLQQGEAYANLFRANQLGYKIIKPGIRDYESMRQLGSEFAKTRKAYITALQTGDTASMAANSAKLNELYSAGKKPWFRSAASASTVIDKANKVGTAASSAAQAGAGVASKGAGALAWTKNALKTGGGTVMACIEGGIETFTEVIPAFSNGGVGEGLLQTAKSGVKVAGSVVGWCAGAKGGAAAGAAIGTAICPGIGTAIGGALGGLIGGLTGSWFGSKVAKTVTGKSYSEKMAAQQQQNQPQIQPQFQPQFQPQPQFNPYSLPGGQPSFGSLNPNLPTYFDYFS